MKCLALFWSNFDVFMTDGSLGTSVLPTFMCMC
jgi:hypothetical protein